MSVREERFTVPGSGGLRLHALHRGDPSSPLLVLLHAAGGNAHWWDHVAPALASRFHTVALDFRGHGDSDYPDETYVGAFHDDLDALLEHLRQPRPILLGHSLGAHVALERAARAGGVAALVLLDLAWGTPTAVRHSARRALSLRFTYPSRELAITRFRFLPSAERVDPELRAAIAEHSVRRDPDGRFGFKFDPRWFALPQRKLPPLGDVRCPTLLVRGAESTLLSAENARGLADEIPGARLVEIPQAGHHVHIDRPAAVLPLVQGFLDEVV
jgi:pimeloyl-ACP methyl ester carboxylesterase